MKKIIILFLLLTFFKGNTQCPAPSNLAYSTVNVQDVVLSWTENGTATEWDVTVVPNFYVGAPLPTDFIMYQLLIHLYLQIFQQQVVMFFLLGHVVLQQKSVHGLPLLLLVVIQMLLIILQLYPLMIFLLKITLKYFQTHLVIFCSLKILKNKF